MHRYAKTLYKPVTPPEWEKRIQVATNKKVPYFFIYAKDKSENQVEDRGLSCTDRLYDKIQSYKFNFQKKQLGTLDYRMLMHNPDIEFGEREKQLVKVYYKIASSIGTYNLSKLDADNTYIEALKNIKDQMLQFGDEQYVVDVLVKQLFCIRNAKHKAIFWDCFGEVVYQNLVSNHAGDNKMCKRCGARFTQMYLHQCLCDTCAAETTVIPQPPQTAFCLDCGKEFIPTSIRQTKCNVCQWVFNELSFKESSRYCESCGAVLPDVRGRGKPAKYCRHCAKMIKRDKGHQRTAKFRSLA